MARPARSRSASLSLYTHDRFTDLCRGPHLARTGEIPADAFKLLNVAGAYWRGDEKQPMLQRIYGTVWLTAEELKAHLAWLEEVERRDHRRLGKELDLFSFHEEAGAGLVYWHPKGARIRAIIEDFWRQQHYKGGYEIVYSPHIGRARLWETSGHLDFYAESMYSPMDIDGLDYYIKPMNCPFHIMIYQSRRRSLPRAADALGRAGHGLSLRAQRRAARADAGARLYPGRRPHLLHAGADRGRDPGGAALLAAVCSRPLASPSSRPTWRRGRRRQSGSRPGGTRRSRR